MPTTTTTDDEDDLPEPPDDLDFSRLHEYSDEEIEAYNRAKERELDEQIEEHLQSLSETEQQAVDSLVDQAEESVQTTTVTFDSGLELTVYERIDGDAETAVEELEALEEQDAPTAVIAEKNCEALAAMCVDEEFSDAETWFAAYRENGMQWLAEITEDVIEPARARADDLGNTRER